MIGSSISGNDLCKEHSYKCICLSINQVHSPIFDDRDNNTKDAMDHGSVLNFKVEALDF